MRVGECKVGDKRVVPSKPALLSKPALPRTPRTRVKRGRPLTAFANIEEAMTKKCSCIVIRNKYNIASAIITAIQHSRFKLNLPNRYQQCRYVPIILTETLNFLKSKNASGFKKVAPCAGDFTFLLSFTKKYRDRFSEK